MTSPLHKGIFLLLTLSLSVPGKSDAATPEKQDENILISSFFKYLYNFSFHDADSMVTVISKSGLDKITLANVRANLYWWKALSGDAIESNIKACDSNLQESIRLSQKDENKDVNSLFNIIYSYSLKARLENYRGNTLKSIINFYKSVNYIEDCQHNNERDERLNLVSGLYLYFMSYIESEYFVIHTMFFTFQKGDKIKGLAYLEECSKSEDEMICTEANYFLMKINTDIEKKYSKALENAIFLTTKHPNNLIYGYEELKLLLKMGREKEAQVFYKNFTEKINSAAFINSIQKKHFLYLSEELVKSSNPD
jgi:hypothetical protein